MSAFDVVLRGGPAHGAYFHGHALEYPPDRIEVAVGMGESVALLDLPDDALELGEVLVEYERVEGVGIVCTRGRGGCCSRVVTYRHRPTMRAIERDAAATGAAL